MVTIFVFYLLKINILAYIFAYFLFLVLGLVNRNFALGARWLLPLLSIFLAHLFKCLTKKDAGNKA